jgi:hypothetical protein
VSFVHRFGASLNRHLHDHCCVLDGVFEPLAAGGVQFRQASALALAPEAVAAIEAQVRRRVLRWFSRHGLLDPDDARDMLTWDNSGFSLDASVCIAGHDRAELERLLRDCARPPFALERIEQVNDERTVYRLPKLQRDGRTALSLTPLKFIDHLAALPPAAAAPPSLPWVLAPNAPLRLAATAYGRDADLTSPPPPPEASPHAAVAPSSRSPALDIGHGSQVAHEPEPRQRIFLIQRQQIGSRYDALALRVPRRVPLDREQPHLVVGQVQTVDHRRIVGGEQQLTIRRLGLEPNRQALGQTRRQARVERLIQVVDGEQSRRTWRETEDGGEQHVESAIADIVASGRSGAPP